MGRECHAPQRYVSAQEDLNSTRLRLHEIVKEAGHIFILYQTFYYELNRVEYYRGRCIYRILQASIAIIFG